MGRPRPRPAGVAGHDELHEERAASIAALRSRRPLQPARTRSEVCIYLGKRFFFVNLVRGPLCSLLQVVYTSVYYSSYDTQVCISYKTEKKTAVISGISSIPMLARCVWCFHRACYASYMSPCNMLCDMCIWCVRTHARWFYFYVLVLPVRLGSVRNKYQAIFICLFFPLFYKYYYYDYFNYIIVTDGTGWLEEAVRLAFQHPTAIPQVQIYKSCELY